MSKSNRVIVVIRYFETAPLEAAQTALALARRVVMQRACAEAPVAKAVKPRRRKALVGAGPSVPAGQASPLLPGKRRIGMPPSSAGAAILGDSGKG